MNKSKLLTTAVIVVMMALLGTPCQAEVTYNLFGKPLTFMGYVQQGVGYGIESGSYKNEQTGHFDSKRDFQSFLFQALLEAKYEPDPNLKIFASGKLNADWAYEIYRSNSEWRNKGFHEGRSRLFILDNDKDLLNEAHVTWTPGSFNFRLGKQIVAWGETDGFRLMDQINPQDTRRGMGDVQFENSILPLWLVKAEYNAPVSSTWLQELGYQIVFNPNLQFRGNERIEPGNERYGIWSANLKEPLSPPPPFFGNYPFDYAHIGSWVDDVSKPSRAFDHQGMEIGGRVRGVINDAIVTLNGFYGRDNDIVRRVVGPPLGFPFSIPTSSFDNRMVFNLQTEAYYPILRYVGGTFSKDFPSLAVSALGGVAPTVRAEAMYVFDFTNASTLQTFEKSDEIRWMAGADWKVKINWLNPTAYFFLSGQFYNRHIMDYAKGVPGVRYKLTDYSGNIRQDNYQTTLMISTSYFHTKLQPMLFWLCDMTGHSNLFKAQVAWEPDNHWKYTLGALWVHGTEKGVNFEPLKNKDQAYFTVAYRF
jgi:hypothetical protein